MIMMSVSISNYNNQDNLISSSKLALAYSEHGALQKTECAETTAQPFSTLSYADHGDDGDYCQ